MLKLYESTPGTLIMSLRSGGPIAAIIEPIINPNNLHIEGWYVEDNRSKEHLVLLTTDIRDVLPQGFAVNDHEVLVKADELVRLKEIMELRFRLNGLKVTSESGKNYGKVSDFAFETSSMFIQKLYVSQSIVKNFSGGTLSVDRTQIVEVTDRRIIIEDPTQTAGAQARSAGVIS